MIEDATFKLIEEVSQDDEVQLQKDTDTYFDCRTRSMNFPSAIHIACDTQTFSAGADECATAEAIYDCGKTSTVSEGSVAKMVVAVETNATVIIQFADEIFKCV